MRLAVWLAAGLEKTAQAAPAEPVKAAATRAATKRRPRRGRTRVPAESEERGREIIVLAQLQLKPDGVHEGPGLQPETDGWWAAWVAWTVMTTSAAPDW